RAAPTLRSFPTRRSSDLINDCHAVFVAKIGGCPKSDLQAAGIEPVDQFAHEFIEKSAIAWFKSYLDKVNSGEIQHVVRGDAEIRSEEHTSELQSRFDLVC